MSNHASEIDPQMRETMRRYFESHQWLGATGKFPRGKLTDRDDGEIIVAIAADVARQTVIVDFGKKPVAWIGFTAEQALEIADLLTKRAFELRGIRS